MANTIEILLKLKDQASGQLDKFNKNLGITKGQVKAAGIAMTGLGIGALKIVSDYRQLNSQLGMTGITIGATEKQMRDLALATTDVSFKLDSVARTFEVLARAGMRNRDEMRDTALAFDALADATGSSAEVLADQLAPAYKAFGIALPKSTAEMDKWTWLVKNTLVDVSDFGMLMKYLAPNMDTLSVSMDDAIAIMAVLESRGISGTAATMAFRQAVTQAIAENRSLNDVLGISAEELRLMIEKLGEAEGATEQYAKAAEGQHGILDKLKQKYNELVLKFGEFLAPLENVMGGVVTLGASLTILTTTIKGVTVAQWLWNAAMLANPIGLIVLGIAAVIAAIVLLIIKWDWVKENIIDGAWYIQMAILAILGPFGLIIFIILQVWKHWNDITGFISDSVDVIKSAWGGIADFFTGIWDGIASGVKTAISGVTDALSALWDGITDTVKDPVGAIKSVWDGVSGFFSGLWDGIKTTASTAWDTITGYIAKSFVNAVLIWSGITGTFSWIWDTISGIWDTAWAVISDIALAPVGFIKESWGKLFWFFVDLWDGIRLVIGGAVNLIGGIINALIEGIEYGINAAIGAINAIPDISIPSWIPGVGGNSFGIPDIGAVSFPRIPALASGGIVNRPTVAMIGEAGPEAVVPLSGGRGGMGALTVYVTVQGTVIAERDLALTVREELLKLKNRNVTTGL